MILRLTDELSRKIKLTPTELVPLNANPFADWSCHIFTSGRTPYILAANTASLYVVLFPGRRITRNTHFESALLGQLQTCIMGDGFEFLYKRLIDTEGGEISYSRPLNPSITGALKDLSEMANYHIENEKRALEDVAEQLNHAPLSIIGHAHPRDAFRALSFQR